MKKLTDEQVLEIAEGLEQGLSCYLNRKTNGFIVIPTAIAEDFENGEAEEFVDEMREYRRNPHFYNAIHPLPPSDAFEIMKMFLALDGLDPKFRRKLGECLGQNKPFAKFKRLLQERGGIELQAWYKFKSEKIADWVELTLQKMKWR